MPGVTELRVLPALELTFPAGLPGFKGVRRFRLEPLGGGARQNPFGRLIALEPITLADGTLAETVRLVVAAPGLLWPDYAVVISEETASLLELDDADDATALVVVTLAESLDASTANLAAPIVVNARRQLAAQVIPPRLDALGGSFRARLPVARF